jgi:hypothetical protein
VSCLWSCYSRHAVSDFREVTTTVMIIISQKNIVQRLDCRKTEKTGFNSRPKQGTSLLHRFQTGPGAHPASYTVGSRDYYLGENRPAREANHSPPSSVELKNAQRYTSTPQYIFMAWCLINRPGTVLVVFSVMTPYSLNSYILFRRS